MIQLVFFSLLTISLTYQNQVPPEDYPSIHCAFLSNPSLEDVGNYGDGTCRNSFEDQEVLIKRITLVSNDGETPLGGTYNFNNWTLTRVSVLNFGRYHGSVREIGLYNENGTGTAAIGINNFSGQGVRMFLEIYGIQ